MARMMELSWLRQFIRGISIYSAGYMLHIMEHTEYNYRVLHTFHTCRILSSNNQLHNNTS